MRLSSIYSAVSGGQGDVPGRCGVLRAAASEPAGDVPVGHGFPQGWCQRRDRYSMVSGADGRRSTLPCAGRPHTTDSLKGDRYSMTRHLRERFSLPSRPVATTVEDLVPVPEPVRHSAFVSESAGTGRWRVVRRPAS
jgi:hypothetical protein